MYKGMRMVRGRVAVTALAIGVCPRQPRSPHTHQRGTPRMLDLHWCAMNKATVSRTAEALAEAARVGPFFILEPWCSSGQWRPLHELISDPALSDLVSHTRSVLALRARIAANEIEERVAASVMFLGLVSRLVSPQLGAAVLGGVVPDLTVTDLWWRSPGNGLWPLAAGPVGGFYVGDMAATSQTRRVAELLSDRMSGITAPLATAFATSFRLSLRVLNGNVASALAGASAMLANSYPPRAGTTQRLAAQILASEPLRGTGMFVRPDTAVLRVEFVRRSCCLLYRVPGAGTCGDCVLTAGRAAR